jgi:hypothetical protein
VAVQSDESVALTRKAQNALTQEAKHAFQLDLMQRSSTAHRFVEKLVADVPDTHRLDGKKLQGT